MNSERKTTESDREAWTVKIGLFVLTVLVGSSGVLCSVLSTREVDITHYQGIRLGDELPSGDLWVEQGGTLVRMDTLSTDPELPFDVAVVPYKGRVGAIAVTRSVLEEDLLDEWNGWMRQLIGEHREPNTLVELIDESRRDQPHLFAVLYEQGDLKLNAAWTDQEGDQIAATAFPTHRRGYWHIVVSYAWNRARDELQPG